MAFVKTMMSVFGFPRFIPASRFFANAGETVTDLSSASGKKSWLTGNRNRYAQRLVLINAHHGPLRRPAPYAFVGCHSVVGDFQDGVA